VSQLTTLSPDDLPPRTTTVDITAPRFELHRQGDTYVVGHPGHWEVTDLAAVPDTILMIATAGYLRAGAGR
jgi:hypothetical protein